MNHLTATYSPEDNKLRLYSATRLDAETYARVKANGFKWAPKQELFVAPMWTPSREDLLLELCGEIGDEDTSLVERAEERAERFSDYSEKREADAERAHNYVSSIADNIPMGQPILVGHHSEKRARKDAEKIENGMRKAINLWETSKYWTSRAKGALSHAKYKELPKVRARRIKGIEADKRKSERSKAQAENMLALWSTEGLTLETAIYFCGRTDAGWLRLPRKEGDKEDFNQNPSAHDALTNGFPTLYAPRTLEEVIEHAKRVYPRTMAHCDRWIAHYENRLAYEKAMLDEQGASDLLKPKARPTLLPLCNYRQESFSIENRWNKGQFETLRQVEMTSAAYKAIYEDHKGTRIVDNSHRVRIALDPSGSGPSWQRSWVVCFLTDSKEHKKPGAIEKEIKSPEPPKFEPRTYVAPEPTKFDALKEAIKAGVQVVSAPQLFPTPPEIAKQMVEAAEIEPGHLVLEPSVGTGNLVREIIASVDTEIVGYEINAKLAAQADSKFPSYRLHTHCMDFLEATEGQGCFDRVVMNPPFENGADIKHIRHALTFLRPGGRLVALCANGPRQQKEFADYNYQPLPAGSFSSQGTGVNVAMVIIDKEREEMTETAPTASILDVEPITIQGSVDPQPLPPFFLDGGCDTKQKLSQGRLF
jgi:protein-L-isoaspartate O-methyltransferase